LARTRSTLLARCTNGNPGGLAGWRGRAGSGVGADVADDELRDLGLSTQHHDAGVEDVVDRDAMCRDERELGRATLDERVGLLVRRGRLAGSESPMPRALAGAFQVDLD